MPRIDSRIINFMYIYYIDNIVKIVVVALHDRTNLEWSLDSQSDGIAYFIRYKVKTLVSVFDMVARRWYE